MNRVRAEAEGAPLLEAQQDLAKLRKRFADLEREHADLKRRHEKLVVHLFKREKRELRRQRAAR